MNLKVSFDHAQKRLSHDRIAVVAGGLELNGPYFEDTWIDPVTGTLMLKPAPLHPEWFTLNTGIYQKYAKANLTFADSAKWVEDYKQGTADAGPWLSSTEPAAGYAKTPNLVKNKAIYFSVFSYNAGDNFILAEGGWGTGTNYLNDLSWRLYSGGEFELWRSGVLVGIYNVSGAISGAQQSQIEISLLFIPCRRRELLVVTRNGNGFSHPFDDITENDPDPIITPGGVPFWFQLPTASAQVQVAPINYPSTGYATSLDYQFGVAPEGSDTLETFDNPAFAGGADQAWRIYGDPPYTGWGESGTQATLVNKTNGAFSANGVNKECRIKVTLDGEADGSFTPFVYAAQIAYASINEDTDASELFAVDDYLEELSIDIPDDPTGVTFRTQLLRPEELEASELANLKRVNNRPANVSLNDVVWIDAQGGSPQWEMSTNDATQRLTIEFRDRWKSLENYRFKDRVPLDGMQLTDALAFIAKRAGLDDDDLEFDSLDFLLPDTPGPEAGDFNIVIEIGDTAAEWFQRLVEDFSATWFYGFKPTSGGVKLWFKSPATLDGEPFVYELWPSISDAITAGKPELEAWKWVYREYSEETLPPEANDIRVTGYDPRLKRPLQSHYPDNASQDPTLTPSSRPDNWIGEPLLYGLIDPAITNQDLCDGAARLLFDRMTPVRIVAEIECEALILPDSVPVWRGDNVYLHGKGLFRVISGCIDSEKEPKVDDSWQWRPAHYCLELKSAEVIVEA